MQLMTDKHIRHLVVCEDDRMIGFLSIGDLLKPRSMRRTPRSKTWKTSSSACCELAPYPLLVVRPLADARYGNPDRLTGCVCGA